MLDILFIIVAGVAGAATFAIIAKKYGNDCIP
jgi:hypothetical protein